MSRYAFLSVVQADSGGTGEKRPDYTALLESVRSVIAREHSKELAAALDDATAAERLRSLIGKTVFNSAFLSALTAVLAALLPFVVTSFRSQKAANGRLARLCSSMTVISGSYVVTEDLIASVRENLGILEYPGPFRDFLTYASVTDTDVSSALRRTENGVNNAYFSQWVDALVLAQEDRSLRHVAAGVVDSMHDVLAAQEEADAEMYAVWREYLLTLILIFSVPLVFKVLMPEAYVTMTASLAGQGLMVLLLAAIVFSVFRAVKINRPLMLQGGDRS